MSFHSSGKEAASRAIRLAAVIAAAATLPLAAASCSRSPLSPVGEPAGDAVIGTRTAASPGDRREIPAIGPITITREGDRLRFSIEIDPGGEPAAALAAPAPHASASWTFRLYLDADRDPHTGDGGGADFALMPRRDGRIGLWRRQSQRWEPTLSTSMLWTSSRIAFDLPASALGNDDGLVDYALDVYEDVPSSSGPGSVPSASFAGHSGRPPDERTQVPAVAHLRADVRMGVLFLTGQLGTRGHRATAEYSPYDTGGWCLQVFLNTDQRSTGYWLGFDYVDRGVEWNPVSEVTLVRRITLDPAYPGGWGPASGEATLRVSRGSFAIAIPLGTIGNDDGNVDFALETYATVACRGCDSGYSHEYAADYFGSSSTGERIPIAVAPWPTASGPERSSPRPAGLGAAWFTPARTPSRP
jgi:hypothetical protein